MGVTYAGDGAWFWDGNYECVKCGDEITADQVQDNDQLCEDCFWELIDEGADEDDLDEIDEEDVDDDF